MDEHSRRKGKVLRSQFGTAARKKTFMLQTIFVFVGDSDLLSRRPMVSGTSRADRA
jgi:hypothetical protein